MFLTLTIETKSGSADIRIDSAQIVGQGLVVLRETGRLPSGPAPDYFRSHLNQTMVSAWKTFEDEKIFDGDILTAIE